MRGIWIAAAVLLAGGAAAWAQMGPGMGMGQGMGQGMGTGGGMGQGTGMGQGGRRR